MRFLLEAYVSSLFANSLLSIYKADILNYS